MLKEKKKYILPVKYTSSVMGLKIALKVSVKT